MNGTGGTWFVVGMVIAIFVTMLWFLIEATGGF